MFSGIVEELGVVYSMERKNSNIRFGIESNFASELKIDQSVAHNGVCLTVIAIENDIHYVDAILETLQKSNLGQLEPGDKVNLERSLKLNDRLDGHIVQGHVDQTAVLIKLEDLEGSWNYTFQFEEKANHVLIEKGSISVNGVSLTISGLFDDNTFQVSIIPYTYEHTNFKQLKVGHKINVEFDVLGKYIEKLQSV